MKNTICTLLFSLGSFFCGYTQSPGGTGFVKREGSFFQLDGQPYYYIGANYWQGPLLATSAFGKKGRKRLQRELSFLVSKGITNLRILAGAEGTGLENRTYRVGPPLQPRRGMFSEDALRGLDYLLSEMDKRNMKAVIYLSNNWEWSGGFLQYLNWNGLITDSVLKSKLNWDEYRDYVSKFYQCAPCKEDYSRQVKLIIGRTNAYTHKKYADDPVIMAWELGNEPRPMRPIANPAYKQWVSETASLIKSLDSSHLVTIGTEGQASTDDNLQVWENIHEDKNIDYFTIHVWPKNWGYFNDTAIAASMPAIINNTKAYVGKHAAIAVGLNKPLVIEEFGLPRNKQSFDPSSATTLRDQYYRLLFSICRQNKIDKGVIAGCNFWAFGGKGRPVKGQPFWKPGDNYEGDPPGEEQGLNAVFDSDLSTWQLIQSFTSKTAPIK